MPLLGSVQVPIYEYVCMSCESHFEELVGMSDADPSCPDCGHERVAKQLSAFVAHGAAGQPSLGAGGCCGGNCGCGDCALADRVRRPDRELRTLRAREDEDAGRF